MSLNRALIPSVPSFPRSLVPKLHLGTPLVREAVLRLIGRAISKKLWPYRSFARSLRHRADGGYRAARGKTAEKMASVFLKKLGPASPQTQTTPCSSEVELRHFHKNRAVFTCVDAGRKIASPTASATPAATTPRSIPRRDSSLWILHLLPLLTARESRPRNPRPAASVTGPRRAARCFPSASRA
jgi:hypothetical protein